MSPFLLVYLVASVAALAIGWLKGGHAERLGSVILLTGWMLAAPLNHIRLGDLRWAVALLDLATLAAFLWLALRYHRWWPLGVSACLILILVVHLSALLPEMTAMGEASAQLGLGMLVVLFLAAGAFERWLAGEAPASRSAVWARRKPAT